jgi:hypothetical protein
VDDFSLSNIRTKKEEGMQLVNLGESNVLDDRGSSSLDIKLFGEAALYMPSCFVEQQVMI